MTPTDPWLDIIGIGEDGMAGLSADARARVTAADVIIGGDRHHFLADNVTAERVRWPSPFDAMIDTIRSYRGKKLVVLVTGDPLWYSVGARILRSIPAEDIRFFPQLSAFQWAAARMGWSLADCETVTVHGRAVSQILPHVAPQVRLLLLTKDASTPGAVAALLTGQGFGQSEIVALAALGGVNEARFEGRAETWSHTVPDFHTLAIECHAGPQARWYPRTGGLPDDAFLHDGQMTKRDVRAITLAKLAPYPDAVLWDVGAGSGSIGIEWMRAARGAQAVAIEPRSERCARIRENCVRLGTEKLMLIEGTAPEALHALPQPDAIFIGGGMTDEGVFDACWAALRSGGRLVANGVTLETEAMLATLHNRHGGELTRVQVAHAEPVGPYRGWRAAMPVTQWCVEKRVDGPQKEKGPSV
ncbi:MAG: precorrin-6y C5,15-methyltransferase (decarboxylating) subunit CbiE [Pseudomonadota bacterium]